MSRDNQEKHSPIEPDSSIEVAKAGDAWMNYVQDFEKLRQFWKNLGPVTGLWIAQQIDIFAGKYPSKPEPDTSLQPVKDEGAMAWLKKEGYPDVMPMTLDNLGIILDRYTKYLSSL